MRSVKGPKLALRLHCKGFTTSHVIALFAELELELYQSNQDMHPLYKGRELIIIQYKEPYVHPELLALRGGLRLWPRLQLSCRCLQRFLVQAKSVSRGCCRENPAPVRQDWKLECIRSVRASQVIHVRVRGRF